MPERKKKKSLRSKKRPARKALKKKAVKAPKKKTAAAGHDTISVLDQNGKVVETLTLDPIFVEHAVNTDVVYQAILKYQAGEREGTASTLDRGHVRGGGKKPWKQKGTGRARHASRRSPIWRGGGVTFGPMPRDYSYSLPPTVKRRAVAEVVKDKVLNNKLFVLSRLSVETPKTKAVSQILKALKLEKPLFLVDQRSENLVLASRNIPGVSVKTSGEVNALDVASHHECVMTKGAYSGLVKRLKTS